MKEVSVMKKNIWLFLFLIVVIAMIPMVAFAATTWTNAEKTDIRSIYDYEYYKSNYSDLQKAFGSNQESYFNHLLNYGIGEKRLWSRVYNHSEYHNAYTDLQKAFNGDPSKLLKHFITYGMNEQRLGNSTFNVKNYAANYVDLSATFLNNWKLYYAHYTTYGYKEKRNATTLIAQPQPVAQGNTLPAGAVLKTDQYIRSTNGRFTAMLQAKDGNFVIYKGMNFKPSKAIWSTKTTSNSGGWFTLQKDGNLVVYNSSNKPKWSPQIEGKGAVKLVMENTGNLVAYTINNAIVWASNTVQASPTIRTFSVPASGSSSFSSPKNIGDLNGYGNQEVQITLNFVSPVKEIKVYRVPIPIQAPFDISRVTDYNNVSISDKCFIVDFDDTNYWKALSGNSGNICLAVTYASSSLVQYYNIAFNRSAASNSSWGVNTGPSIGMPKDGAALSSVPSEYQGKYSAKTEYGTGTVTVYANTVNLGSVLAEIDVIAGNDIVTIHSIIGFGKPTLFGDMKRTSNGEIWMRAIVENTSPFSTLTMDININNNGLLVVSNVQSNYKNSNAAASVVYKKN